MSKQLSVVPRTEREWGIAFRWVLLGFIVGIVLGVVIV